MSHFKWNLSFVSPQGPESSRIFSHLIKLSYISRLAISIYCTLSMKGRDGRIIWDKVQENFQMLIFDDNRLKF